MMRSLFKIKRTRTISGKRNDRIILILCFSVLALLIARNLLVFFKPTPTATTESQAPEAKTPAHPARYRIGEPAGPLQKTEKTGGEKQLIGKQPARMDAAAAEKTAPSAKNDVPLGEPKAAPAQILPPNPSMASNNSKGKASEGKPEAEFPQPPDTKVSVKPRKMPINKAPVVSALEKPSVPTAEKKNTSPSKTEVPPPIDRYVYSVQVGTYKGMKYADRMVKTVRNKGFDASVLKLKDGSGRFWYVVQTGDYVTKAEAQSEAMKFQAATGMSPAVVWISEKLLAERKINSPDLDETDPDPMGKLGNDPPAQKEEPPDSNNVPANQTADAAPSIATAKSRPGAPSETGLSIPDLRDRIRRAAYADAARSYRQQMARFPGRYTIRLEVDCSDESVQTAFIQGNYDPQMFILPFRFKSNACYLVLWGLYESEQNAADALPGLPPFFKAQAYPPAPVLLDTYMTP